MQIILKRTGCLPIKIDNASKHDVGLYLHMAAASNNTGDLEMIQICNNVKDPVKEVKVI